MKNIPRVLKMWKCSKCKKIGGFRVAKTSVAEVNKHSPRCNKCNKKTSWEAVTTEILVSRFC